MGCKRGAFLLLVLVLAGVLALTAGLSGAEGEKPDLEIEQISAPSSLMAGQAATVTAQVYNTGGGKAEPFAVTLYAGDTEVGTRTVAASVYGGERETVSFSWTPAAAGTVVLKAVADSGQAVDESEEGNNERTKEVTVAAAAALALVSTSPDYTLAAPGETISPGSEVSLLFNKPVEIVPSVTTEVTLYCNKSDATSLAKSAASNNKIGDYDGVLQVDEENPCKVIVNLTDENNNPILKSNRIYVIKLGTNVIKARGSGEYCTSFKSTLVSSLWKFNTGAVPYQVLLEGPERLVAGRTSRPAASVADIDGNAVEGVNLVWSTGNEEVASVSSTGLVTGVKKGKVTITALYQDESGYYADKSATWSLEVRADYAHQLSSSWLYEIPTGNDMRYLGVPVAGADGSVYYVCQKTATGPYTLRALDEEGNPKDGFKNPVVTVEPVPATIGGREYLLTAREELFLALDPQSGDTLWSVALPADIVLPPRLTAGGLVLVGCETNMLYALQPETHEIQWKFNAAKDLQAMCAGGNVGDHFQMVPGVDEAGRVYLVAGDTLSVLDGAGGTLQWQFTAPYPILNQAGIAPDGTVILLAGDSADSTVRYLYGLTPPVAAGSSPAVRWSRTDLYQLSGLGKQPVLDPEGNVYFLVRETAGSDLLIAAFDPRDGAIARRLSGTPGFGLWGADNRLYTNSEIYDPEGEPIAYYDDYPNNLSFFHYGYFSLGEDGTLYRFWLIGSVLAGVEKAVFYDLSGSQPASLEVDQDNVTLYNRGTKRIVPRVRDQNGMTLSGAELVWASSDESLVTVADGLLTASAQNTGQAEITVSVKDDPEISAAISVTVRSTPVPAGLYLIEERAGYGSLDTEEAARAYRVEKIRGQVGEGLPSVSLFVYDQHGDIITTEPLTWNLADGNVASMLNYAGLSSNDNYRYDASLRGKEAGSTTLTATLDHYPALSCTLAVEVVPPSYNILWSAALDGAYWQKWAQHVMGRNGEIFYINNNELKAVEKNGGSLLWTADLGDQYGISLGLRPRVGPEGTVYAFSTTSTLVLAVDPGTGTVKWKYRAGTDGVADVQAGEDRVYALTAGGKLYALDLAGQSLWAQPLDLGRENGGFLLSEEGLLYTAGARGIGRVDGAQQETLLYTPEAGASLSLKTLTPEGDLLFEEETEEGHTLVSLSPAGTKNWTYALDRSVQAACSEEGVIYLVYSKNSATGEKTSFVFLNGDGEERCAGVLDPGGVCIHVGAAYTADFTPVPGGNGVVYLVGDWIYALDDSTGEILRTIQTGDQYALMPPQSLTVDEAGILYAACGEMGLIAVQETATYGEGVEISLGNLAGWQAGALGELNLTVKNTLGEEKNLVILADLVGSDGTVPARTRLGVALAAGREEVLPLGLRLPASRDYRLLITVRDGETETTYATVRKDLSE